MTTQHHFRSIRPLRIAGFLMALGTMALSACSSVHTEITPDSKVQKKVHWTFKRNAVTLDVSADLDLNLADKRPHTLVVGVMELRDPNAFLPLVQDPDRAMETLAAGKKRAGVLEVWRFIVPPGAHQKLTVDRMRNAMYLGVIAGYSDYSSKHDILLRPLPVRVKRSGIIFRSNHYSPALTLSTVRLGSRHLLGVTVLDPLSDKKAKKDKKEISQMPGEVSLAIRPL